MSDALQYAQDFLTIFKAVGWRVNSAESVGQPAARQAGLAIVVSEDHSLPPSAEAFRDALRIYGVEVERIYDPTASVTTGSFILRIGEHL